MRALSIYASGMYSMYCTEQTHQILKRALSKGPFINAELTYKELMHVLSTSGPDACAEHTHKERMLMISLRIRI
jgi:hypothetical protein